MESLRSRLAAVADPNRRLPWPDRPIRLTLAITDLDVGGAEGALAALAVRLDRRRWDPSVICLSREGALVEVLQAAGVPCDCLDVDPRRPLRAVGRVVRALRKNRPELVQSFLFHANLAVKLAAPWAGRPWVVGGIRVAERRKRWHVALDRLTCRLAAGSVCVSDGVRRFSRESGLPDDRLTVIPNGVDPAPFDRAERVPRAAIGVPESARLALFVGRLDAQKGLPELLDAAAWVAERSPAWRLAIVGDGPERNWLLDRLDRRTCDGGDAAGRGLADRVHWLGRRSDVPGLMKSADLLVLPSHWEGMPNVVLEAMAARLAVAATRIEGTEELVVPGRTGWLVPAGDAEALGRALLAAVDNPELCREYGAAGRRRVEELHAPGRIVAAYEELWAGLLGYQPPAPAAPAS